MMGCGIRIILFEIPKVPDDLPRCTKEWVGFSTWTRIGFQKNFKSWYERWLCDLARAKWATEAAEAAGVERVDNLAKRSQAHHKWNG